MVLIHKCIAIWWTKIWHIVKKIVFFKGKFNSDNFFNIIFFSILHKSFSFLRDIQLTCNCYWSIQPPILNGTPACEVSDKCRLTKTIDYQNNQSSYYQTYSAECPLECNKIKYSTRVSSQNYPSREQYELFKENTTLVHYYTNDLNLDVSSYTSYRKYFFKLNIFYDSMEYTYVTLSPKITLVGLLLNLGGSIGLCVGFSLFTFFEALEIFVRVFYILIFKNWL